VWKANEAAAQGLQFIIKRGAGLSTVAANQSSTVVAFWVEHLDPEKIARILNDRYDIVVAQGQQDLKGKVLRVSALGKTADQIKDFGRAFAATLDELGAGFSMHALDDELNRILEDCSLWESLRS
jgi:aspartate aminotransferase-like enzyme